MRLRKRITAAITVALISATKKKQLILRQSPVQRLPAMYEAELESKHLLDVSIVLKVITNQTCCAKCEKLSLRAVEKFQSRRGLVTDLSLVCQSSHQTAKFSDPNSEDAIKLNRFSSSQWDLLEVDCIAWRSSAAL